MLEKDTLAESLQKVVQSLKEKKQSLGFAESCTGGLLSARLTELPGVSDIYKGAIVSYANSVKVDVLAVDPKVLEEEGAVSEAVARGMSQGLRKKLNVDWAVSITGIAGPGGGTQMKPVGTVCFAFIGPQVERSFTKNFSGDRKQIQSASVAFAIEKLKEFLESSD